MSKRPVVLITGAGRGIGAETAKLAAAQGYDVAVNYKSDAASASSVVEAVKAKGGRSVAIQADMAIEADIERMFREADAVLGRITHFVYNTGIPGRAGRLEGAEPSMMREVIDVNVLGALFSLQHAIKRISRKQGGEGGAIVLLSSVAADIGGPNEYVWYAASKGAIESITYGLSKELAGDGIRVNCVSPGGVDTPMAAGAKTMFESEQHFLDFATSRQLIKTFATSGDIIPTVLFLASDDAGLITGAAIPVEGGHMAW